MRTFSRTPSAWSRSSSTHEPSGPSNASIAPSKPKSAQRLPSIRSTMSPMRTPARNAGEPGIGQETTISPSSSFTVTPMPTSSPRSSRSSASISSFTR